MSSFGKKAAAAVLVAAMVTGTLGMAGCSGSSSNSSSSSASCSASSSAAAQVADTKAEVPSLGSSENGAKSVVLDNQLGVAITNIAVKDASAEEYPAGLIVDGSAWNNGDQRKVYFASAEAAQDVSITVGETVYELHNVDLASLEEAKIMVQDGIAYLSYQKNGATETTLAAEQDYAAQQQAAAEEAQRQAEEEAAAEQQQEEQSYSDNSSQGGSTYTYGSAGGSGSTGGSGSGSVSGQSGDGCVSGGVVLR